MFWNDPSLYSTTFPYKEFGTLPVPYPFFNPYIPKFVPPTYDFRMFIQPWMQTPFFPNYNVPFMQPQGFTPFMQPQGFNPFAQPQGFNPFVQPQGFTPYVNPLQHFQRPFPY